MQVDNGAFSLNKLEVRAVLEFVDTSVSPEDLGKGCVHFDPKKGLVVACDGHMLVLCRGQQVGSQRSGEPFNVHPQSLSVAAGMLRGKSDTLLVRSSATGYTIAVGGVLQGSVFPRAEFVPYEMVLPFDMGKERDRIAAERKKLCDRLPVICRRWARSCRVGVNPFYLSRLALVSRACWDMTSKRHGAPSCQMTIPEDELSPIRFDFVRTDSMAEWTVVLMPMRIAT